MNRIFSVLVLLVAVLVVSSAAAAPEARAEYRTGQFCSKSKEAEYNKHGFTCKPAKDGRNRLHKLGGGSKGKAKPAKKFGKPQAGKVSRVVDGDTIRVRIKGKVKVVRIIGINSPERGKCGYTEARNSLRRLASSGKKVKLVRDLGQAKKDKYGRLLRYLHRGKRDVGRLQIRRGWAKVYVVGKDFHRKTAYRKSQRQAKSRDRGTWGLC